MSGLFLLLEDPVYKKSKFRCERIVLYNVVGFLLHLNNKFFNIIFISSISLQRPANCLQSQCKS